MLSQHFSAKFIAFTWLTCHYSTGNISLHGGPVAILFSWLAHFHITRCALLPNTPLYTKFGHTHYWQACIRRPACRSPVGWWLRLGSSAVYQSLLIISPVTGCAATWPLELELKFFLSNKCVCLRLLKCVLAIIIVTIAHIAAIFAVVRTWLIMSMINSDRFPVFI